MTKCVEREVVLDFNVFNFTGQPKRRIYKRSFKLSVIEEVESGKHPMDVAKAFNTSRSNVIKWIQEKPRLIEAAKLEYKNNFKIRPSVKYDGLYPALAEKYQEFRAKGCRIDFLWLWANAQKIFQEQQDDSSAHVDHHMISNFIRKYNLHIRRKQSLASVPNDGVILQLQDWHSLLRERLVRTGSEEEYDWKWGRFPPNCRFNVDQLSCPFLSVTNLMRQLNTTETNDKSKIFIPSTERQCSLQICCSPEGPQPRLGVVFRTPKKCITDDESSLWHPEVDVYFQENAWVDSKVALEWVENTLKHATSHLNRFVLFADNLNGQVGSEFKDAVRNCSGVVWYGPPNAASEIWQPIEAGYGKMLQSFMEQELYRWLEDDEHVQRWYGNKEPYTDKEKRILITHWAGEAYGRLIRQDYNQFRRSVWFKSGCLITADGSCDEQIRPNGLADYKMPPPCKFLAPLSQLPSSNNVDSVEYPPSEDILEIIEGETKDVAMEKIDKEEDRIKDDLVDRRIKALYESGCFFGKIMYFNKFLNEYYVKFDDSTEDYFTPDDINGVEVELILN